jgi:hypothetical protein
LRRLNIKEEWRLVIIVLRDVICVILSIESELDRGLPPVVGRWRNAGSSGRVQDRCTNPSAKGLEGAEGGIRNVKQNAIFRFSLTLWSTSLCEWLEIVATEVELVATSLRSKIWLEHRDLWVIVVPIVDALLRLLLSIQ